LRGGGTAPLTLRAILHVGDKRWKLRVRGRQLRELCVKLEVETLIRLAKSVRRKEARGARTRTKDDSDGLGQLSPDDVARRLANSAGVRGLALDLGQRASDWRLTQAPLAWLDLACTDPDLRAKREPPGWDSEAAGVTGPDVGQGSGGALCVECAPAATNTDEDGARVSDGDLAPGGSDGSRRGSRRERSGAVSVTSDLEVAPGPPDGRRGRVRLNSAQAAGEVQRWEGSRRDQPGEPWWQEPAPAWQETASPPASAAAAPTSAGEVAASHAISRAGWSDADHHRGYQLPNERSPTVRLSSVRVLITDARLHWGLAVTLKDNHGVVRVGLPGGALGSQTPAEGRGHCGPSERQG
jgi:hypothetical protein